jgi:hypothetical protein
MTFSLLIIQKLSLKGLTERYRLVGWLDPTMTETNKLMLSLLNKSSAPIRTIAYNIVS